MDPRLRMPSSPFLYPVFDTKFSPDLVRDAREAVRAGVQIFQLRAKNISIREIFGIVEELSPDCTSKQVRMIINDYVDIVLVSGAAGVHLGQEDFPVRETRSLLGEKIIGFSTHNREQFQAAAGLPVDYIAIGPIFQTSTKVSLHPSLGPEFVREVRPGCPVPLVCIGGIRKEHFPELLAAGADGIALISELYRGPGIYHTIRGMLDELDSFRQSV